MRVQDSTSVQLTPHPNLLPLRGEGVKTKLPPKGVARELIGKISFTDLFSYHLMQRMPTPADTAILDAVLVTRMGHGLTPSTIATRLSIHSSPAPCSTYQKLKG